MPPDVVLLLSILPVLFEVATFYTGRDERAIKARRTINHREGYKKPFHANIWADLRSLVTTLASVATEQVELSLDFLESATSLLQVIEEDIIKVPSTDDLDLENLVRSVHFRPLCMIAMPTVSQARSRSGAICKDSTAPRAHPNENGPASPGREGRMAVRTNQFQTAGPTGAASHHRARPRLLPKGVWSR